MDEGQKIFNSILYYFILQASLVTQLLEDPAYSTIEAFIIPG